MGHIDSRLAEQNLQIRNPLLRLLFKIGAIVCIALGIIGIFLPLLPTTPFMLLAVYLSLRSSEKIHCWLLNHKQFGPPLKRYLDKRSISRRIFWRATIVMWCSMSFAIWLVKPLPLKLMLLVIACSVTLYMTRLVKNNRKRRLKCPT